MTMASAHDDISVSDSASAGAGRRAAAHDTLGTSSDSAAVLLTLGPALVRTSASLELKVIRPRGVAATGATRALGGRSRGTSSTAGDMMVVPPTEAADSQRQRVQVPGGIEIGVTRPAWLIGTATAMGTVAQIVAPGDRIAGLAGLAVGYAWAWWRWNQRS